MPKNSTKTNSGSWVKSDIKLDGKTVIVTGANTGIGLETCIDMAQRDAKVIMACRNMEKAEEAKTTVVDESKSDKVSIKKLDLSSLESVRNFAREINAEEERLDILINNAGVMMCPQSKTVDGFEMQMGTNHLGHFLLTNLLLDLIKKSAPSRIVNLSSMAHQTNFITKIYWDDLQMDKNYTPILAYSQSKLMNVMFTRELFNKLQGTEVTTYAVHPGGVNTELSRHTKEGSSGFFFRIASYLFRPFLKSPKHGAQTSIYCAIAPEVLEHSGSYFMDCHLADGSMNPVAKDDEQNKRLWDVSEEMVGLKEEPV